MNFTLTEKPNYYLIRSNVEKLDASNASELKSEILLLNKKGINNMILDLSESKYCDSSGLSAILIGNRLCKDSSGTFAICGLQANVEKLINISQLDKVLNISKDQKSAEQSLG
ncbi:MAG: STAS domain-containing protein [Putridiphycobacter sp.]